jgi:signal transduction histidine kinase
LGDRGIKALEQSIERLRQEAEELRASRTRLVLAADADRRRIERELHDGAQQDLVGLAVNLQQARRLIATDPAAAAALVDEMRRDAHEALDRSRALAQRIHPPQLEAGGLRAALRSAAASVRIRTRIDVVADGDLLPEVAATVYLCCVAALERFHDRTTAAITVREENGTLAFEVVADDAGLETADEGLTAMRDRVEALGGRLSVAPGPGGGIRIAGALPMGEDASRSPRGRGSPP